MFYFLGINYDVSMKSLAERALNTINEKFKIHQVHEFACFLWPTFKNLRMLPFETKNRIIQQVGEALLKYELIRMNSTETNTIQETISHDSEFEEWEDSSSQNVLRSSLQEVQDYQNDICGKIDNILKWWKVNNTRFQLLSELAKYILAIPASSASSERCFSTTGRIIEKRRTNLNGETVDSLMFLHDYYKKLKF